MKTSAVLILLLFSFYCKSQEPEKFNLGFESKSAKTNLPEGWFKWGNYPLSIDSLVSHSGKYSALITSPEENISFGSIAYAIPANFVGKSIQLEGYMKIEEVKNGFAGLLLRVDGGGSSLAFDNMQQQGITGTHDWTKYSITLLYPDQAERIYVAGILSGEGKAWFDDFVLTIDGESVQIKKEAEKPVFPASLDSAFDKGSSIKFPELNETVISNLELLGRIWGFLKYHHPEVAKGNYNWDYELFRILPEYEKAEQTKARDQILIEWIDKYGSVQECTGCNAASANAKLKPDLSWIEKSNMSSSLKNRLNSIYQNRHQGDHYYIDLVPNILNPIFKNENAYGGMPYPDEGFRLLALYRYWNIIHYFFPYKHLTDKDWDETLKEYIPKFIGAGNELEYELAAIQIIGDVKDTHANLWSGDNKIQEKKGNYFPPVHLRVVEDKFVVDDYFNPELAEIAGLRKGDIITQIDGRSVESIADSLRLYYPASNDSKRMYDIAEDLLRSSNEKINIEYISEGQKHSLELSLYPREKLNFYHLYRRDEEKSFRLLDGDIGYITLKSIKSQDIAPIKEMFRNTKGIIIDIRNYPSTFVPFSLGSYFVSSPVPFVKFTTANINNPGEFTFTKQLDIPPDQEPYRGKLVVIVNEVSLSQAEYTTMAFRAGDNTTVIGSTTAGADGNISPILLPGGLRTIISGIGVYYPDGKETQRVGIVPDLIVKPTIEGIRDGRDELLEKAMEIINNSVTIQKK